MCPFGVDPSVNPVVGGLKDSQSGSAATQCLQHRALVQATIRAAPRKVRRLTPTRQLCENPFGAGERRSDNNAVQRMRRNSGIKRGQFLSPPMLRLRFSSSVWNHAPSVPFTRSSKLIVRIGPQRRQRGPISPIAKQRWVNQNASQFMIYCPRLRTRQCRCQSPARGRRTRPQKAVRDALFNHAAARCRPARKAAGL